MKVCKICFQEKNEFDFSSNELTKDGFQHICKICYNQKYNKPRLENIKKTKEKYRLDRKRKYIYELKKEYFGRIKLSLVDKLTEKEKEKLYKLKRRAWDSIMTELRAERLKKLNHCIICESKNDIHKHHEDYEKPYDILWLCAKCHGKIHRIKGEYYERGIEVSFKIARKINVENKEKSQGRNKVNQ